MILVRGATDGAKVAAELLDFKRRNEDPRYRFDVMTQEALIVGNAPVSSFIAAALRLALNPDDSLSRAVYNHYLGRPFDRPLDDSERDFFRSVRLLSPEEAFERIVMRHALQGDRRQTAYLQAIHEQIIAFSRDENRRHSAVPPLVGGDGQKPLAVGRGERHDGRDHHHPQGQGA